MSRACLPRRALGGDAHDNTAAESFIVTIKKELIHRHTYKASSTARLTILDHVERFYDLS